MRSSKLKTKTLDFESVLIHQSTMLSQNSTNHQCYHKVQSPFLWEILSFLFKTKGVSCLRNDCTLEQFIMIPGYYFIAKVLIS